MTIPCRVLMVYPKFIPNSFWNYTEACELVGAKYPAAPLGLITVAAMLPNDWDIRLVDRNTEPLTDADLDWADLVMIGGMLNQQPDFIYLIDLVHRHGKPVCRLVKPTSLLGCGLSGDRGGRGNHFTFYLRLDEGRAQGRVHRREIQDRRHAKPDAALRSDQIRSLSLHRRAIFARLPVHL